jgi:signal transduction histidine kinase
VRSRGRLDRLDRLDRIRARLVARGWALLTGPRLTGFWAALAGILAVAAVSALGVLGNTGGGSVAILYLIPPLAVTVLVHRRLGILISADAAFVWAVSDAPHSGQSLALLSFEAAVRFLVVGLSVLLVSALREAVIRATHSEARFRDFLALAARQLRTPVAGLRASAEALIGLDSSPAQERLLSNIAAESERAGRLVSSLLAIGRLDAEASDGRGLRPGRDALSDAVADLVAVCADAVDTARRSSPTLLVTLRTSEDSVVVAADAESCRHILGNLLDNASRHAEEWIEVALSVNAAGSRAVVHVRDDGPGLPAGREELAFESFVSLDGAGGSGLGLPLSRGLARSFGGDLAYEQHVFVLTLPAAVASPKGFSLRRRRIGAPGGTGATNDRLVRLTARNRDA